MAAKKRRQHGSGGVFQRKDGRWIGTIDVGFTSTGGRRRVTVSSKTEAECKRKLRDKIKEIDSGAVVTASPRMTVKVWSETWLDQTQHSIRPKTWQANRSTVRQWVMPVFGHKRISDITPADIEAMNNAMRAKGRKTSTMSRTQNVVNRMFKDAIIAGHRVHPGVILVKKTPIKKSDRTSIPLPDALALLQVIEREPDPSRWVGVLLNGMRQGERLGLTWDCVDFESSLLNVSWQLQELQYKDNRNKHLGFRVPDDHESKQLITRWHLTRHKTAAGHRLIPMTVWMENSLKAWRNVAPYSPYGLVWPTSDGGPIDPKDDRLEWYRLQDETGFRHPAGRHFYGHEGRHTTITLLKGLGIEDEIIEQIVGQSKLVKDYVHVDLMPKTRAAMEQLATQLALGN